MNIAIRKQMNLTVIYTKYHVFIFKNESENVSQNFAMLSGTFVLQNRHTIKFNTVWKRIMQLKSHFH